MLIKTKALNVTELDSKITIDQIKSNCIAHFLQHFYKLAVTDTNCGEEEYIKNLYSRLEIVEADKMNISLDAIEAEFDVGARAVATEQYKLCKELINILAEPPEDIKSAIYLTVTQAPEGFSAPSIQNSEETMVKAAKLFVKTHNYLCHNFVQHMVIHIVKIADVTYYYYTLPGTENLQCPDYVVDLSAVEK